MVNAILWILRTGAPWRDLPAGVCWKTAASRLYRWTTSGTWQKVLDALQKDADEEGKIDWSKHFADMPFPKKVRDELISGGRASVHPPLPDSGWVRRRMDGPGDVAEVIELFRMNYERLKGPAERRKVK